MKIFEAKHIDIKQLNIKKSKMNKLCLSRGVLIPLKKIRPILHSKKQRIVGCLQDSKGILAIMNGNEKIDKQCKAA